MLLSARESSRILAAVGIPRQQSRRALLSGLAGPAVAAGGALLYEESRVRDLASWPAIDHEELLALCSSGVLVVRLGPGEEPGAHLGWQARAEAVRCQPSVGFAAWLQVHAAVCECARLPCVVTVCGFPVLTADLTSIRPSGHGRAGSVVRLDLEPAGSWAEALDQRRLVTGPGPRWLLLGSQPYVGRAARERDGREPVHAGRETMWERWA